MKHSEKILVALRSDVMPILTIDQGVSEPRALISKLDLLPTSYKVRHEMENNPLFKQIIPYALIVRGDKILTYRRAKGSGEGRLLGKKSIGFGGHVDHIRMEEWNNVLAIVNAANRELEEEVGFKITLMSQIGYIFCMINNDADEVGEVHIGVGMKFNAPHNWEPEQREDGVAELEWATMDELMEDYDEYETWSQMLIYHLLKKPVSKIFAK